ncbi:2-isopropylmalate synthase [Geobacter hydrogenophilus]|uniref:2-isopropylmalate synthase n=1 Tax=Geobacter hydrogenophilus TaxID=40983 RepID=A0A9W6FZA4_9BACT|nr:2-isopropylmalate synthase [Geobacter hydrogenophilus]MBT0893737.1 2-isopropylmalate synthase [Geobacter hydrogenophilus]GLI37567.1 2-isopropylmalate synthase [Geobacter hydrogenophilus]
MATAPNGDERQIVRIFDTTLRDGEQSPGNSMNIEEKLRVARQLEKLRVDVIEAGFPIASEGDFEAVRLIAQQIRGPQIAGFCRALDADIDRAWEALQYAGENARIHTFIATSDIHMKYKLKMEPARVLDAAVKAVRRAASYTPNVEFACEDAVRTRLPFLAEVVEAVIDAGATTVNIPDTVGYTIPFEYFSIIRYLKENVRNIDRAVISVHCHNDLGLAVANSIAAVQAGARQVECAINGIGERAGNCSLEEFVMALRTRHDILPFATNVVTEQLTPASRLLTAITGIGVQPNKAIVGANAFAHEAGIHQHGMLMDKSTYEIMTPESVGLSSSALVLGKHSGRHAFKKRLEALGHHLDEECLNRAFERFKALADLKKEVFDEDLDALVVDESRQEAKYRLEQITVTCGSPAVATATVQLAIDGRPARMAELGDGPVDAAIKAINRLVKGKAKLLQYNVGSITGGSDAQGEVTVRVAEGENAVVGKGASTDIVEASAKAYVNALNRLSFRQKRFGETA